MQKKTLAVAALLLTAVSLYWGCTKTAEKPAETGNGSDCTPRFPDQHVTYENYVKNIIRTYCTSSCHNGNGGISPGDFRTYAGLRPYTGAFNIRVIQDHADMPQGNAPLPKSIRDSLNIWIGNCAPEN
ncbi:hypothetical protein [Compostibacter hankyongensis]|uniref:Cytochrome C Planctomycete-type domain-containing protein n=1 Tax=Compostibacter hankyongensis TaxID=1007089 RepID=A0ABP8FP95_9BACT